MFARLSKFREVLECGCPLPLSPDLACRTLEAKRRISLKPESLRLVPSPPAIFETISSELQDPELPTDLRSLNRAACSIKSARPSRDNATAELESAISQPALSDSVRKAHANPLRPGRSACHQPECLSRANKPPESACCVAPNVRLGP